MFTFLVAIIILLSKNKPFAANDIEGQIYNTLCNDTRKV